MFYLLIKYKIVYEKYITLARLYNYALGIALKHITWLSVHLYGRR